VGILDILDDGVEGSMLAMSRRSRVARLSAAALVGGLLAFYFGPRPAMLWGAANLACEGWLFYLQRTFKPTGNLATIRLRRIAPPAIFGCLWATMATLSAVHGVAAMKFAAILILFGMIIEGVRYAMVSPGGMLSMTLWPFSALVALTLLAPRFTAWDRAVALVVMLGLIGYVADTVRTMRATAKALEHAQAEAQEASRAKSAFLAMMSHEVRTPMNGVLGLAHALRGTGLDARQTQYLDMIEESGHGLMTILNDVLDLSKVEAGKLELDIAPFDIRRSAAQIALVWSETARLKGLDLTLEVDPATPAWLAGDDARVRQILRNLVSNAVKFTETGRVTIHIAPGDAGGIMLSVSDTGAGLSPEQRDRLFTPFAQGDRTIARRFGGTGLGLTICRRLAGMMGGDISVASVEGEGATFTVTLALSATEAPEKAREAVAKLDLGGVRVLVVDDNEINQIVARAVLETAGALVAVAGDGHAALARLRVEDFDVVLMDVHMPGMDGVEAVRRIRAGEGGRVDVPVVALTADVMAGDAERLLAQGFDDAHPKPIQPAGLLATVAAALRPAAACARGEPEARSLLTVG